VSIDPDLRASDDDGRAAEARPPGLLSRLLHRPSAVIAALYLCILVIVAIAAPLIASHDPSATSLLARYQRPSGGHLLGTDQLGRDEFSRLVFGARTSLQASAISVAVSLALGVPLGLVAGYFGGLVDMILSRTIDALMSVPGLVLALGVIAVLGPDLNHAMLAIGIIFAPRVFRVMRASALEVRQTTFVEASEAIGCSRMRILTTHVLPNSLSPLLVVIAVSLGTAVLAEAGLSFLGLGVQPPTPSWGGMLADAKSRLDLKYLVLSPGLALTVTIAAFTSLGESLDLVTSSRRAGNH
jgi:peptide/nickel transport system permease protein